MEERSLSTVFLSKAGLLLYKYLIRFKIYFQLLSDKFFEYFSDRRLTGLKLVYNYCIQSCIPLYV